MTQAHKGQRAKSVRRGRPPLTPGEPKRASFNTRLRTDLKKRLEAEAANVGRSLSEEIEFRLELSVRSDDDRLRDFGDELTLRLMRALATSKMMAEVTTGKRALKDPETAEVAYRAMTGILDAAFHVRPGGVEDRTTPDIGQELIFADPEARSLGENIRDAILGGLGPVLPGLQAAFKKWK